MKISKVRIHNFRSIHDLQFICKDCNLFLGENNSGKSNIISALDFALTPTRRPDPEDLFAFKEDGDNELWVEVTFISLTEEEETEFRDYILSDGSICLRKTALFEDDKVSIGYRAYRSEPKDDWLKSSNVTNLTKRDVVQETDLNQILLENGLGSGRLTKDHIFEARAQYIDQNRQNLEFNLELELAPFLGKKSLSSGYLPEFYFVPALRDVNEESKFKSTTMFGRLLSSAIEDMSNSNDQFVKIQKDMEALISTFNSSIENADRPTELTQLEKELKSELEDWGDIDVTIQVDPPNVGKLFELGTNLLLDDGYKTLPQRKGHGLQRAVIFGLIKSWASVIQKRKNSPQGSGRKSSESIIFAVEEPELFLHPQAQIKLEKSLRQLSYSNNHQIFLCSHSPHFIDLDNYQDITIVTKSSIKEGTQVTQCQEQLFNPKSDKQRKKSFNIASWINPDRGSMFFAKKVVFVEGETEKAALPFLASKLDCFDPDISFIDCGSKHNLPLYIKIANAFSLNYHVLHDEDPLPDPIPESWNKDKLRSVKATYNLNAEIEKLSQGKGRVDLFCPDFEKMSGISLNQSKKKGKPLAALDFFDQIKNEDISAQLIEIVDSIYKK